VPGQDRQCSSPTGQTHKIQPRTIRYTLLKFRARGRQCQGWTNNAPHHQDSLIRFRFRHSGTGPSISGLGRTNNAPQHQDSLIRFWLRHSNKGPSCSVPGQDRQCSSPPGQSHKIQPLGTEVRAPQFQGSEGQTMLLPARTVT
jgi:hypothetical protein